MSRTGKENIMNTNTSVLELPGNEYRETRPGSVSPSGGTVPLVLGLLGFILPFFFGFFVLFAAPLGAMMVLLLGTMWISVSGLISIVAIREASNVEEDCRARNQSIPGATIAAKFFGVLGIIILMLNIGLLIWIV
jgi:hypothetical protein